MQKWCKYIFPLGIVFVIFMSLHYDVCAQSRSNPFEIKPRLKEVPISDTLIRDTLSKVQAKLQSDTLSLSIDSISLVSSPPSANSKANPFEVDHVPIRKSIVDKKTEDIKTITESTKGSTRFLFFFLILGCALLAIVLGTGRKILNLISKSLINENILKLYYREDLFRPSTFILYLIFVINFSAFLYLAATQYGGPSGIVTYGLIMAVVFAVYLIRHTTLLFLGIVFPVSKPAGIFSFTVMVFNHFIGLILIPINLFLALGPVEYKYYVLIFTIFLLAFLYLLRTFRGVFILSEYFIERFFQIIIYLCAFEIVPMLILWKTISNFLE